MNAPLWILTVTLFFGALPVAAVAQDPATRRYTPAVRARDTMPQRPAREARQTDIAQFVGKAPKGVKIQRAAGRTETASVGAVELGPGDILGATVGNRAVWRKDLAPMGGSDSGVLALPFRFIMASGTDTQVLIVTTIPTTLLFSPDENAFGGTVNFVLRDSLHPTREGPLPSPVNFLAVVPVGTVSPENFPLQRINLPPTAVRVTTTTRDDSLPLHVSTTLNPQGVDVWLQVAHNLITVEPVHRKIWGYGLQQTAIHVTLPSEAGSAKRVVRLRASAGEPSPSTLTLAGGETGDVTIRSSGGGTDTIWADAGRFTSGPATIIYSSPIVFLVAALLGAVLGGALTGVRPARDYRRRVLAGLFVAVAFTIGLNLTGVEIPTHVGEAVIFVVAGLGALVGVAGIKAVLSPTKRST